MSLVPLLASHGEYEIVVTSRVERESSWKNVTYVQGKFAL